MSTLPVCVVVGVGPGNGAAFARRFAADGYAVALLARAAPTELAEGLAHARAYACDVTDAAAVERTFAAIRADLGELRAVIYNAGSGVFGTFDEVSAADLESAWRVNVLGAFLVGKAVAPAMAAAGEGAIVFVGATASRRGGARAAAFAPAKMAQRGLAESMARHLGPKGVHVALIVLDGIVDLPRTRTAMPGKPDDFFLSPDGIAETAAWLVKQPRRAWSFEVEARPFGEAW